MLEHYRLIEVDVILIFTLLILPTALTFADEKQCFDVLRVVITLHADVWGGEAVGIKDPVLLENDRDKIVGTKKRGVFLH